MKNKIYIFTALFIAMPFIFFGQFRQIYKDADSTNEIRNISFISAKEGYVTFDNFIGYTQDSGHTFTKKYITLSNVDYSGYSVNLTFGFTLKGVYIFSKDSFLVYGDYGFVPSILFTKDQGNTFKLIYNATLQLSAQNKGILNMIFPQHSNIGYAVETNGILKTTNKGLSWATIFNDANNSYFDIDFFTDLSGLAVSNNTLIKTTNGGNSWQSITVPPGNIQAINFLTENKGWLVIDNNIYYTSNGGVLWAIKNNSEFYSVGAPVTFLNDSTGYSVGEKFTVNKTTDSGKIWEPLPRDNNYSYYGYSHNKLFFLNASSIWAGGGHGFLELSTNGGGTTLPVSKFTQDFSSLNTDSVVRLINYSKTGYQYRWLKNSVLFSSSYNATYVSERLTIDTIKLIVIKGPYADTSLAIIDTRANIQRCFAAFQAQIDTGSVKFLPGYQTVGVKHYWYFGDGNIDSINTSPVHTYSTKGNFTVSHKVYNTIDKCSDSTTSVVTIIRTQNCLSGSFTYTADSFYTNTITVKLHFDSTKESVIYAIGTWSFGDGSAPIANITHAYSSSGYYTVCANVTNYYTGCISNICQPVHVQLTDTCNADFLIRTQSDKNGYILAPRNIQFDGKPYSVKTGKRNSWVINNTDTLNTGNDENLTTDFFTSDIDPNFSTANNDCGYNDIAEICIDSLTKKVTHIIYDSVSHCTSSSSQTFTVPRQYQPFIKAVPDVNLPTYVSFYAYTGSDSNGYPYSTVWRIRPAGGGGGYYTGDYVGATNKLTYTFEYPGNYTISVGAQGCDGTIREVYYINYYVAPVACPIYPPDFSYKLYNINDLYTINFFDFTVNQNGTGSNTYIWYFGDGDSSIQPLHTYTAFGVYNVTLKYTSPDGCSKQITKPVTVGPLCSVTAAFSLFRDPSNTAKIIITNNTISTDTTVTYKWYFGNGDSSAAKNPVYSYTASGTYHLQLISSINTSCVSMSDTTLVISDADICNLNSSFTKEIVNNAVYFTNTSIPAMPYYLHTWYFGDGTSDTTSSPVHKYSQPGTYEVCLSVYRDTICNKSFCDSVVIKALDNQNIKVIPNPVTSSFVLQYNSTESEQTVIDILNGSGIKISSLLQQSRVGSNTFTINSAGLPSGYYILRITSSSGKKTQISFIKL